KTGDMSIYLLNYIMMLKYNLKGVIRKVQEFLRINNDLDLSVKGINNALLRVGDACRNEYIAIHDRIRRSKWVHIDETGFHVEGKKFWLWAFRSAENDVLVVITDSRGRNVVRDTMGEDFHSPVIVDGWKAYSYLTIIQRCWAHLIREVDAFKSSGKGKELSDDIHTMFGELKKFLESKDMDLRKSMKEKFDTRMDELVDLYDPYEELHKPVEYVRNGLGSWFTCLLYPGMEPTNNLAEQAIREHVVIRKIIGTFRSENGSQNYQYISSLLATWNLKGKSMFAEMDKILRKELCGFG
ncbi:transposase IS66, partial [mine drainage metagenome]